WWSHRVLSSRRLLRGGVILSGVLVGGNQLFVDGGRREEVDRLGADEPLVEMAGGELAVDTDREQFGLLLDADRLDDGATRGERATGREIHQRRRSADDRGEPVGASGV